MSAPARTASAAPAWDADPPLRSGELISVGGGLPVPPIFGRSGNPNSGGRYPLGRKFTVGDEATFRITDLNTGSERRQYTHRVTRIDAEGDRVHINDGVVVYDAMGNWVKLAALEFLQPKQMLPAELHVGRKWTAVYQVRREGRPSLPSTMDYRITAREPVAVPAGTFDAFKIEGRGWSEANRLEETLWVVPWLNWNLRLDRVVRSGSFNALLVTDRFDLIGATQQAIDSSPP